MTLFDPEVLIAIIGLIGIYLKQNMQNKQFLAEQAKLSDLVTDKDKQQDINAQKQEANMEKLAKDIAEIKKDRSDERYRKYVLKEVKKAGDAVINANYLDNSELLALLILSIEKYISVIEDIIDTDIKELNIETIRTDMSNVQGYIKRNIDFSKIDVDDVYAFKQSVKVEVATSIKDVFIMRLEDEILRNSNKYNGTFEKIAVGTMTLFITKLIKQYRDHKKK